MYIDLNSIILLTLGSFLTIVGGLVTNFISQRTLTKSEDKKALREKCEQISEMANQVIDWVRAKIYSIAVLQGKEKEYGDYFIFFTIYRKEIEFDFNRFFTLINL